jgi:DNA-binding response OmpR family regulator
MVNVLLLEDDPNYRGIIERVIRRNYSYAVRSVATEKQAWEALSGDDFDLILLDLNIDGKRCWETLKRAVKHPGKPVAIVFSCEDTKGNADYAMSHGAYTFLSKPFNFARLKTTIDSALRAKQGNGPVSPDTPWGERKSNGGAAPDAGFGPGIGTASRAAGNATEGGSFAGTVLVVGRDRPDREPLVEILLPNGFTVKEASSGPAAIEAMKQESIDIVLLEIDEVAPEALESCWFLREHRDEAKGVPVLAVTGPREEAVVAALRAGADDFFGGPLEGNLLSEKIRAHVRLRKEYERRLEQGIVHGYRATVEGADSNVYFRIRLKEELERTLRYKKQLTLAILALNNVEDPAMVEDSVNKENPHHPKKSRRVPAGDYSLADIPHTIRTAFRRTDIFATSGENEFSVLMPETRSDRIFMRISDLREKMQKDLSRAGDGKPGVAVRVGMASLPLDSPAKSAVKYVRSPEEFFRMARLALFQARLNENSPVAIFDA